MKLSKIIGGIAVVALVAIGVGSLHHSPAPADQNQAPLPGAVSSADIYSPYLNVNGIYKWYQKQAITLSTTTPCAIKSPAATSTLAFSAINITTGSSTATTWTVANATSPYATTTLLFPAFSLGSGAQGALIATASSSPNTPTILAPNTWIVWGVAGFTNPGTVLRGTCQAQFNQI